MTDKQLYIFGPYRLDSAEKVLERDGKTVPLPPKDLEILVVLVQRAGHIVSKEELLEKVWPGVFIEEGNLSRYIFNLRQAFRDGIDGQKYIETVPRRGYRFTAAAVEAGGSSPALRETPEERYISTVPGKGYGFGVPVSNGGSSSAHRLPRQEIRYCKTDDGVTIAYSTVGKGYPLVKAANWLNHLEYEWESPLWQHWIREFSRHHRLIRYDERGNGLSAWNVEDLSFAAWLRDLEAVVHAAAPEKFALMGISQGGAVAIDYAVRHPERVSHLVLCNAFAQGYELYGTPKGIDARRAMGTLMRLGWGKNNPSFSSLFTNAYIPENASSEHQQWFNDLQRISASPENASLIMRLCDTLDVRAMLPELKIPTLVLHSDRDHVIPSRAGRLLAAEIPNARFVPLNTGNHILLDEPAWHIFLEEVGNFLGW